MGYELKRNKKIAECVTIDGEDIPVLIEIGSKSFSEQFITLQAAQANLKQGSNDEKMAAFGDAMVSMLRLTFGDDGAHKILEFYEGNYIEMLENIMPFFNDVVIPYVVQSSRERANNLAKASKTKRFFR